MTPSALLIRRKAVSLDDTLILVGLGANLEARQSVSPLATCQAALARLVECGVGPRRRSSWYVSAPIPESDQNWYINGVVVVDTCLAPSFLLEQLLRVERSFGRARSDRGGARTLDLDLLAYGRMVCNDGSRQGLILPHPRILQRAFVLQPMVEVAPSWSHPVNGRSIGKLAVSLGRDQYLLAFSSPLLEIKDKICDNS